MNPWQITRVSLSIHTLALADMDLLCVILAVPVLRAAIRTSMDMLLPFVLMIMVVLLMWHLLYCRYLYSYLWMMKWLRSCYSGDGNPPKDMCVVVPEAPGSRWYCRYHTARRLTPSTRTKRNLKSRKVFTRIKKSVQESRIPLRSDAGILNPSSISPRDENANNNNNDTI